jgi:hypothetical protein
MLRCQGGEGERYAVVPWDRRFSYGPWTWAQHSGLEPRGFKKSGVCHGAAWTTAVPESFPPQPALMPEICFDGTD